MNSARDTFLILGSIFFIIVVGGAVYEHVAFVPQWSAAVPASLSSLQGDYGLKAEYFWMGIHPITLLFLIGALIVNWKNLRRRNILITLGGYVLILIITSIYFVPELIDLQDTPYTTSVDNALTQRAGMWETLSLIRLGVLFILAYILLSALPKSGQVAVVAQPTAVPLSYPNDSLGG